MSSADPGVEAKLARSGEAHQPPYAWQEQVWRRLEEPYVAPDAPKRSGSALWLFASLAIVVLFAGGGMAMLMQLEDKAAERRDRAAIAAEVMRMKQAIRATDAEIDAAQEKIDMAFAQLEAAKDEESKQSAITARNQAKLDLKNARERKMAQQSAMVAQAKAKVVRAKKRAKARVAKCAKAEAPCDKQGIKANTIDACSKSNDPLCGL